MGAAYREDVPLHPGDAGGEEEDGDAGGDTELGRVEATATMYQHSFDCPARRLRGPVESRRGIWDSPSNDSSGYQGPSACRLPAPRRRVLGLGEG